MYNRRIMSVIPFYHMPLADGLRAVPGAVPSARAAARR